MHTKLFVLFLAASLALAACSGNATATVLPPTAAATSTPVIQTVVFEHTVEVPVTVTPLPATPTLVFTATPDATATLSNDEEMNNLLATAEATDWTQVQVGLYSKGVPVGDETWELVLSTHNAATTRNGRYEAVESSPVGVVGITDHGWCNEDQLDCPPHALLVRVEVPTQFLSCVTAAMDISWRIQLETANCGQPVPVRISIRENNITRSQSELMADYLSLAGLKQQVLNATSEVGLFVSVKKTGTSEMDYGTTVIPFGYSCWDCLADTMGVDEPQPVPLIGSNISNFGPGTPPTGNSLLSGVVFPLPRPGNTAFELSFELELAPATPLTVWVGRYDAQPAANATPAPTMAPTATKTPAP